MGLNSSNKALSGLHGPITTDNSDSSLLQTLNLTNMNILDDYKPESQEIDIEALRKS